MRIKLTDELIKTGLQCPPGKKRLEFVDISDAIGLYILVNAAREGEGVYFYRYRSPRTGKTRHARIGRTTEVSLEDARQEAKRLRAKVTLRIDPQDEKKACPDSCPTAKVPLLRDFFTQQYLPYARTLKRGWNKERQIFELRLREEFGDQRLDEIALPHVQSFHTGLLKDGNLAPATANHAVKLLRHVLNVAVSWDLIEKNGLARVVLAREENQRARYLNDIELARLVKVLKAGCPRSRNAADLALLLLATGARLNEALTATWRNIDLDEQHRLWRIPAANSKSGKIRSVPLNDAALEVLESLPTRGKHEWLFVNYYGERLKHIHRCWNRLRVKAGLPHLRLHDLRHQYASMLVNSGRSLYEVQLILGHSNPAVSARYSHLSTRTMADAAQAASDAIQGALRRSA